MPVLLQCPASASLREIGGASPCCTLKEKINGSAGRSVTSTTAAGAGLLLLRRQWSQSTSSSSPVVMCMPVSSKTQHADLLSVNVEGTMRTASWRQKKHKHWVVRSSSSDQSEEASEKKNPQSENRGPPVLTIIAGLLVIFLVFWALGSLVSWLASFIQG